MIVGLVRLWIVYTNCNSIMEWCLTGADDWIFLPGDVPVYVGRRSSSVSDVPLHVWMYTHSACCRGELTVRLCSACNLCCHTLHRHLSGPISALWAWRVFYLYSILSNGPFQDIWGIRYACIVCTWTCTQLIYSMKCNGRLDMHIISDFFSFFDGAIHSGGHTW